MPFSASTMRFLLLSNSAAMRATESCGPLRASTAAAWAIDVGFTVDVPVVIASLVLGILVPMLAALVDTITKETVSLTNRVLEGTSTALALPTITTDLAGFGRTQVAENTQGERFGSVGR